AHVRHHLGRKETTNFLALWPAPCFPTSGPRGIHRLADGMSILSSHMRCLCEMERRRGWGRKTATVPPQHRTIVGPVNPERMKPEAEVVSVNTYWDCQSSTKRRGLCRVEERCCPSRLLERSKAAEQRTMRFKRNKYDSCPRGNSAIGKRLTGPGVRCVGAAFCATSFAG
ncbi:hypothetical protein CSHISOI_04464, partial [Colletotrichum shisoi]